MFKIIYRTLSILAAAGLLAWSMVWFFTSSAGQSLLSSGGQDQAAFSQNTATQSGSGAATIQTNSTSTDRGFDNHDGAGGQGSQRALSDIALNLGKIALITLAVVLTRKGIRLVSRKWPTLQAVKA